MAPVRIDVSHHNKRRKRFVYVIARPTKVAGLLGGLSEGKFPLCHWGVLVSHLNLDALRIQNMMLQLGLDEVEREWGRLFELRRTEEGKNSVHISTFGVERLLTDWPHACIGYIGRTKVSDFGLSMKGIQSMELN